MGQEAGTSGPAVTGAQATQAQDPEQLRQEIEETRQELGDTVEALAAKTDVKAQVKRKLEETKASARERRDEFVGKAKELSPEAAAGAATQVSQTARANPLPFAAAGAFLAGVMTGRLTRR